MISEFKIQTILIFRFKIVMGNCCGKNNSEQKKSDQKYKQDLKKGSYDQSKSKNFLQLSFFLTFILPYKQMQYGDLKSLKHSSFVQISKDIDRTYPNEQYYKKQENKIKFQRLLRRIALYLPKLGYTQGINFLSGYFLLQGMNQNLAFQSMILLMLHSKFLYIGFYEDQFPLAKIYCMIFWLQFERLMPVFANKVKFIDLPDEMWIFQWIICLFLYNFPLEYASYFFNFLIQQKQFGCIKLSIGIMKILEPKFINKNIQSFYQQFVQCLNSTKDINFCKINIPIQEILNQSSKITTESLNISLNCIQIKDNWYLQYLKSPQDEKKVKHKEFVANKQQQYYQFLEKMKSGSSLVSFERNRNSIQIIDNIQQKKNKKFFASMYTKILQKSTKGSDLKFLRLSLKQDLNKDNLIQSMNNKP